VVAQAAADGAPEVGPALLGGLDVEREAKEIEEQIKEKTKKKKTGGSSPAIAFTVTRYCLVQGEGGL